MTPIIEALLDTYERGTVSRREVSRDGRERQSQSGVLRGVNINHVNLQVSNLDRSVEFYRELFSLPPKREIPGRPYALDLADGLSFLSVPQREPTGVIDHFCVAVEDFRARAGSERAPRGRARPESSGRSRQCLRERPRRHPSPDLLAGMAGLGGLEQARAPDLCGQLRKQTSDLGGVRKST